ncbi:hypothetical protein [Methylobacterium radiotolerans]|uniref:Uncharacterized protein n=1 Tax=Methylobacterium radiotolerans (strain ATCC 27329 / DSM 1819 / JCM 2831 / NBRC 15690 / NCIMB 10815 / 0-1) TaxID=426355 RepID=B1M1S0_METRJ|nr:hypothetical protein [Methylobacterium radiotolerans]ACB27653.1 hypothetical protein Mrad2831_5708 [Methylobacterium radiotolerans JCM 2831]GEM95903.1 hypothetical protein MRA01_04430 [Methylobacterium radiotolerans]
MNHDDDGGALVRIAQTLGVPVATFLTAYPPGTPDAGMIVEGLDHPGEDHPAEVVALLRLFVRLKSPEARARCLAYVVQEATHDS